MSGNKTIVTVSVTGSFGDRNTPSLPITPKEIAESALDAGRAGASVAHIHVRDEATGMPSMRFELYEEVVRRLRDHSEMVINLSTGAGARFVPGDKDPAVPGPGTTLALPEKRIEHVLRLQPEICSLDVGSLNFGSHVFVNTTPQVEWMAEQMTGAGIKPELEVFDTGHIEIAEHLMATDRVRRPPLFQLCMGIRWGIPAVPRNMVLMRDALPTDAVWAAFGIGALAFPMLVQAFLLGGHVRIGMEDTLHLAKGQRASSNRELVQKAVQLIGLLGGEPATPADAREMLQLDGR